MLQTEEQIERHAERRMNALDDAYLHSNMTDADYNAGVTAIMLEYNRLLESLARIKHANEHGAGY